jgi:hypothetical protein
VLQERIDDLIVYLARKVRRFPATDAAHVLQVACGTSAPNAAALKKRASELRKERRIRHTAPAPKAGAIKKAKGWDGKTRPSRFVSLNDAQIERAEALASGDRRVSRAKRAVHHDDD